MADVPSVQVYRYTGGGPKVDGEKQTQHDEYRRDEVIPGRDRDLFGSYARLVRHRPRLNLGTST
jgi:hypothetical protein